MLDRVARYREAIKVLGFDPGAFHPDDNPAPVVTVSASQIKTWLDCQRKWALNRLAKIPEKTSRGAEIGGKVHRLLEHWHATGEVLHDEPEIAGILLPVLPYARRGEGTYSEHEFWDPVLDSSGEGPGYLLHGLIDVYQPEGPERYPVLQDLKTTGAWRWRDEYDRGKATDPQALIYGMFALLDNPKATHVRFEWLYSLAGSGRRECRPLVWTVSRRELLVTAAHVLFDVAEAIADARRSGTPAGDFAPNPDACSKFGGCSYRMTVHCTLSSSDTLSSLFGNDAAQLKSTTQGNSMNLLKQLQQSVSNGAAAPAPPALLSPPGGIAPAPVVPAVPAPPPAAKPAPLPGTPEYEAQFAEPLPEGTTSANGLELPPWICASGLVPVAADKSTVRAITKLIAEDRASASAWLDYWAGVYQQEKATTPAVNPPEQVHAISDDEQRAAIEAEKAPKEKAPRKPKQKKGAEEPPAASADPVPTMTLADLADEQRAAPAITYPGTTLYIGCAPVGVAYTDVSPYLEGAHALLRKERSVEDFSAIQYEGSGLFATYAWRALQVPLGAGASHLVVSQPNTREALLVLARLRASVGAVVEATR